MHNQNEAFLHLNDALPADIARRRDMGDLAGALRLIDARLSSGVQPLLAPRLEAERLRLTRLPYDYPYTRPEAVALVRAEWPGFTEAQFDALLDGGRIDWRMVDGELRVHREFLESLRIYPKEAPGLVHEAVDNAERDAVLARMEREGSLTARITLKASIRALVPVAGQEVQAWLDTADRIDRAYALRYTEKTGELYECRYVIYVPCLRESSQLRFGVGGGFFGRTLTLDLDADPKDPQGGGNCLVLLANEGSKPPRLQVELRGRRVDCLITDVDWPLELRTADVSLE